MQHSELSKAGTEQRKCTPRSSAELRACVRPELQRVVANDQSLCSTNHQRQLLVRVRYPADSVMFGGLFGGLGGGVYNQNYRAYPVAFIEKESAEKGDKVILPPSALQTLGAPFVLLHCDVCASITL